ncbi:MAG TPA: hypothetical protein VJB13_01005 [Candidatus Nanoarchaeia archaeon]|nr:hypothetical protein [Candidatus Nanoarchaeia archaeon]
MQEVGLLSYLTLEEGVEKEWEALYVYQNRRSRNLHFRENNALPKNIKQELPDLASCMEWSFAQLHYWYAPLFDDRKEFSELVQKIICSRTFFERSDAFKKKHPSYKKAVGLFYRQPVPHGSEAHKIVQAGSYLKIEKRSWRKVKGLPTFTKKSSSPEIKINLWHEYAHELHYQSFLAGMANHYHQYDRCIGEVIAVNAEKKIKRNIDYEGREYQNYVRLVERLELISEFSSLPFHQQWKQLLQFKTKEELKHYLKKNGV